MDLFKDILKKEYSNKTCFIAIGKLTSLVYSKIWYFKLEDFEVRDSKLGLNHVLRSH